MKINKVPMHRGWRWIVEGVVLFRKNPVNWFLIIGALLVAAKLLLMIPFLGLLAVLAFPLALVGLMEGCRALEHGRELKFGYLLSGCVRNTAALIALGGISLAANLLTLTVIMAVGGDAITAMLKFAAQQKVTPENAHLVREIAPKAMSGILAGWALSIPLLMALWFAPLLVYFNNMKPVAAMVHSLWACWRNMSACLVHGAVLMAALMLATPLVAATGVLDFGLWLIAPVFVPSLYASYRDIFDIDELFTTESAPPAGAAP
jgi:hypothetical protein